MFQFDDPTFWVAAATITFVALVYRPVGKIIVKGLDSRTDRIRTELDEAKRLRAEAEDLLKSFKRKQKDALKEAQSIVDEAREAAEAMKKQAKTDIEAALNKRIALAMEKVSQAEATALNDIRTSAIDIAMTAARTLLEENITKDVAESLVKSSLSDIEKKLH